MRAPAALAPRGFTLVEFMVSFVILLILIGLLVVALGRARGSATQAASRQTVASLQVGVQQFKQQMGFLPPLIKDNNTDKYGSVYPDSIGPLENDTPVAYLASDVDELDFLRGGEVDDVDVDPDMRFSEYALPYYLIGALGEDMNGDPIDGVQGEGFREPTRSGAFKPNGRRFGAFFSVGTANDLVQVDLENGRVELRDRNGVSYRYYRWEHGQTSDEPDPGLVAGPEDLNVPDLVGDPEASTAVRSAKYAIVAAGDDGVFGDVPTETAEAIAQAVNLSPTDPAAKLKQRARDDTIVEIGE